MAVSLATKRYVKALFDAAAEKGVADGLRTEIAQLGELFDGSEPLSAALRDPRLASDGKRRLLQGAGLDTATELLQDFVSLCLDRGRAGVVLELAEEYARLDREARNVMVAKVESARDLTDEFRNSLKAKLEEMTGKSIEVEEETVPDLLGGVRILVGSRLYDGSVRRRIDEIAAHLASTRVA